MKEIIEKINVSELNIGTNRQFLTMKSVGKSVRSMVSVSCHIVCYLFRVSNATLETKTS